MDLSIMQAEVKNHSPATALGYSAWLSLHAAEGKMHP